MTITSALIAAIARLLDEVAELADTSPEAASAAGWLREATSVADLLEASIALSGAVWEPSEAHLTDSERDMALMCLGSIGSLMQLATDLGITEFVREPV